MRKEGGMISASDLMALLFHFCKQGKVSYLCGIKIIQHLFIFTAATLPKSSSFSRSGPGSQLNTKLQKAPSLDVAR